LSFALIGVALLLGTAQIALAHTDPAGSTGTAVSISMTAYRSDGVTLVLAGSGEVTECETIVYEMTVGTGAQPPNAGFYGGTMFITTPDGVDHDVTPVGGIPCIGGTADDPNSAAFGTDCTGAPTSITSQQVSYTVTAADLPGGTCTEGDSIEANAHYGEFTGTAGSTGTDGTAHIGLNDTLGVAGTIPFTLPVTCCPVDTLACNGIETCDPTLAFTDPVNGDPRLGTCVPGEDVVCTDDGNACTAPLVCTEPGGQCVPSGSDVVCPDLFCAPSVCNPQTGACDPTTPPDCDDLNACTEDTCNETTDVCDHNDTVTPTCDPNCEECDTTTGTCVPLDPLPTICVPGEEICRTPGFWGTHGGTEKEGHSENITLAVLNAYCGTLEVCGQLITNTDECSVESALEAICVSPKGDSCLQLGRQLTAAALNCAITKSTNSETGACEFPECVDSTGGVGPACEGLSIGAIWAACNTACGEDPCDVTADVDLDEDPNTPDVEVNCIGAIDCFNNGFTILPDGTCDDTLPTGCHERELCGDFVPPGAAGSPKECADSRKNCVTIFGATDQCDDACVP
jgi:hypothetical protein